MDFPTEEFNKTYKGTRKFSEESKYYEIFLISLQRDKELFEHIRFCNDILKLPPIYVFVKYYKDFFNKPMETNEKRGLGACFGYLFQYIWGYAYAVSAWVGDKTTNIKNASFFIKEADK